MSCDGVGGAHEIAHEPLQIIYQAALIVGDRNGFGLLQLDAARDAGHECLRIFCQPLENAH